MNEVLLTMGDYFGTLAAARTLGRAGVGVALADPRRLAPTRWSRYVRPLACPDLASAPEAFVEWLLATGKREPGRVLLATSDCVAWLFARHRAALSRDFLLYTPPLEVMYTVLDKWRLHHACLELGIDTPRTWLARGADALATIQREARYPLVVKPQTQAFLRPHQKGRIATDGASLAAMIRELARATTHAPIVLEYDPGAGDPVVQEFAESGVEGIYNLSGFIDETGGLFVAAAARKVLQWPRRLGTGLCFEAAEVRPELASDLARMCRHIGYYGPFEVEYLEVGARRLLIDFNPRFFGQMAFDIARGLDLPRLVYLAAMRQHDALALAIETAQRRTAHPNGHAAYTNRIAIELLTRLRRLAGGMSASEEVRWRGWLQAHDEGVTDAVFDRDDWMPSVVEAGAALYECARHPRSTWRAARRG